MGWVHPAFLALFDYTLAQILYSHGITLQGILWQV